LHLVLDILAWAFLAPALAGSAYQVLAGARMSAFRSPPDPEPSAALPEVTILKPLHGAEPGLEQSLASFLEQDYPAGVQVVFGLHDQGDEAWPIVEALRVEERPGRDISLVTAPTVHGPNGKISNLVNMMSEARYDLIVVADSDIAVRRDYLKRVIAALEAPGVGVVSCPYYGEPRAGFWSKLSAMGVTYQFLPSVAVGVTSGLATPCMGSTIAMRREVLDRIGGFQAFAHLLADDYAIGAAVRGLGLRSVVAPIVVAHGCSETSLVELVNHETRWALTNRSLAPIGFFGAGITHAVPLALIGVITSLAEPASLGVLGVAVVSRLWLMTRVDKITGIGHGQWRLAPMRDILSFAIFAGSFFARAVEWRGARFHVNARGALERI
jgi:ceramide glucosyltransferase